MLNPLYATTGPHQPAEGIPMARPWTPLEWARVCVNRGTVDTIFGFMGHDSCHGDVWCTAKELGPKVQCVAVAPGLHIAIQKADKLACCRVSREPGESGSPKGVSLLLSNGSRWTYSMPEADGIYAPVKDGQLHRIWGFLHRQPGTFILDSELLGKSHSWAIIEAYLRLLASGIDGVEAIQLQLEFGERVLEHCWDEVQTAETTAMLEELRQQLQRLEGMQ